LPIEPRYGTHAREGASVGQPGEAGAESPSFAPAVLTAAVRDRGLMRCGMGAFAHGCGRRDHGRFPPRPNPARPPTGGQERCRQACKSEALKWRLIATIGAAGPVALAMATAANATTKITVDSGWQSFITAAGTTVLRSRGRGSSPALLSSKVTVTDAFCHGDESASTTRTSRSVTPARSPRSSLPARSNCSSPRPHEQTQHLQTRRSATASSSSRLETTPSSSRTRRSGRRPVPGPGRSSGLTASPSPRATARTAAG
jgi:hypothetical protein